MTIIHANDPTTKVLTRLYESRGDITSHIDETSTNVSIQAAIRNDSTIMMLGHGNKYGLFSKPSKKEKYERFLITDRHVQFLRNKTCIGIWCYANEFADKYGLHGLFSGMIISELQEAIDNHITATKEEIDHEMVKFTERLRHCIETGDLRSVPCRMSELDDTHSPLTEFNYKNLFFYE